MKMSAPRPVVAARALLRPLMRLTAARHGDDVDEGAEKRAEDQDVEVDLVAHHGERAFKRAHQDVAVHADRINEGTRQNAQNEGGENLLRNERKSNGHDRRDDRKPSGVKRFHENRCPLVFVRQDPLSRSPAARMRLSLTARRQLMPLFVIGL